MPVKERQAAIAAVLLRELPTEPPGLPIAEVRELVNDRVGITESERAAKNYLGGWTVGLQKAGWLVKRRGWWWTTERGRVAARRYADDPEGFYRAWNDAYRAAVAGRLSASSD
jgi:hypothetical protein